MPGPALRPNTGRVEPPGLSPTYQNIVNTFREVTAKATSNDFVYIHYSGHGRRVESVFKHLKSKHTNSLYDEAIVPTDIATNEGCYLRDVELHCLLHKMVQKDLKVFIVLDCCHSGGVTRIYQQSMALRGIPEPDKTSLPPNMSMIPSDELDAAWPSSQGGNSGYTCLAAGGEQDLAYEKRFQNGKVHGALTYSLLYLLKKNYIKPQRKQSTTLTSKTFYDDLVANVRKHFPLQKPLLTGPWNAAFFDIEHSDSFRIPRVTDGSLSEGAEVTIDAGESHGIWKDMVFAICSPQSENSKKRLAYATVIRLDNDTSKMTIQRVLASAPVNLRGCPVAFVSMVTDKKKSIRTFSVADAKIDHALREVRQKLASHDGGAIKLVDRGDEADIDIIVDDKGNYGMQEKGETVPCLFEYLPIQALPKSSEKLVHRVVHYAKFSSIRDITHSDNPVGNGLKVELLPRDNRGMNESEGIYSVTNGQKLTLRATNGTETPLYITVLNLTPAWEITQIYPYGPTEFDVFECGTSRQIDVQMNIPRSINRLSQYRDVVKVFASTVQVGFRWMELSSSGAREYRGEPQACLGELKEVCATLSKERNMVREWVDCPWSVKDIVVFTRP
jgi:hypothetical protein